MGRRQTNFYCPCGRKADTRGKCKMHYSRERRGIPFDAPVRRRGESLRSKIPSEIVGALLAAGMLDAARVVEGLYQLDSRKSQGANR